MSVAQRCCWSAGTPQKRPSSPSGRAISLSRSSGEGLHVGDPPHDLAHQPAVGERVVAVGGPGGVARLGRRDARGHVVPVEHLATVLDHVLDAVEAGLVAHHLADRGPLLAALGELGPVRRDRCVVVDQPPVHVHVQQRGGHALRGGEGDAERVLFPGRSHEVAGSAPDVHDLLAPVVDAGRRAAGLSLLGQDAPQAERDVGEGGVNGSVQHARPPRRG